jgi:tRNA uridine 5-carboxymethylaminomethyl modification enzyme
MEKTTIAPSDTVNALLEEHGSSPITTGIKLAELLRRPEMSYNILEKIDTGRPKLPKSVQTTAEILIKYDGYIKRELAEVERQKKLEDRRLPDSLDYSKIQGLRLEADEKLNEIKPFNIAQASRISGVNPADINVLLIYLSTRKKDND